MGPLLFLVGFLIMITKSAGITTSNGVSDNNLLKGAFITTNSITDQYADEARASLTGSSFTPTRIANQQQQQPFMYGHGPITQNRDMSMSMTTGPSGQPTSNVANQQQIMAAQAAALTTQNQVYQNQNNQQLVGQSPSGTSQQATYTMPMTSPGQQMTGFGQHGQATGHAFYGQPQNQLFGQGPKGEQAMTYYYYHYPMGGYTDGLSSYGDDPYADYDGLNGLNGLSAPILGAGLGGLGAGSLSGLAGFLGLKGLKGLGGLGLLALLKLLKPLLLGLLIPIFLPLLLLIPLILLFIPIPVITIPTAAAPVGGRSIETTEYHTVGSYLTEHALASASAAQEVLNAEECLERIACEIERISRGSPVDKYLSGFIQKAESYFTTTKLKRGLKAYKNSSILPNSDLKCVKYRCSLASYTPPPSNSTISSNNL